jgi:hypothetical protein
MVIQARSCTSLMCSSILIYSKPFCKYVIRAPGGISVKATEDLAMSDSLPNAKAECEKPNEDIDIRTCVVIGVEWLPI